MAALNDQAQWQKDIWLDAVAGRPTTIIDLPADWVLTDDALIDQVIDRIFDQLAKHVVELRVEQRHVLRQSFR